MSLSEVHNPDFPELTPMSLAELNAERSKLLDSARSYTELSDVDLRRLAAILDEMSKRTTPATEARRVARAARPKKPGASAAINLADLAALDPSLFEDNGDSETGEPADETNEKELSQ